jgi:2-polyprenyl-3-methyl-5-hydroxy-6-metoxy-1,4-benzoquinol methylase
VLKVSGRHAAMPLRAPIAESYNRYYGSGLYDARYPRPNPPTYRSALRLARTSSRILDFGAGSGRYTMPFLRATNAFVCAYDISADACQALELQAAAADVGSQRMLITADLDAARAAGPYDLVVALFGVLSHIEGKENRIDILGSIRSVLSREGLLLLTVPNVLRRFPLHVSSDGRSSEGSGAPSARAQARRYFPSARPLATAVPEARSFQRCGSWSQEQRVGVPKVDRCLGVRWLNLVVPATGLQVIGRPSLGDPIE